MQKLMWVVMGVLAVIVAYFTFTSPTWTQISVLHTILGG